MDDGTELTAWQETTGMVLPFPQHSGSLQSSTARGTDPIDSGAKFAEMLTPCLILVAPSGMGEAEREVWLHAAWAALKHLPADLIKIGAQAAMLKADHPSKIVPAIIAEVGDIWKRRQAHAPVERPLALPAPIETEAEKQQRLELAEMMGALARRLEANAS